MDVQVPAERADRAPADRDGVRRVRADSPEAYIPGDRRRALAAGVELPEHVDGTALFADISAFTTLTESLAAELGPQRGAEELAATLETVFEAVLGALHRFGGTVIYFSGDAVTCWIDGDDGLAGVACAFEMQAQMARVGTITTPGGTVVQLGMKVAVASGRARRFVAGDPAIQLIDVLAGSLMDRLAAAEHDAQRDQVVIDAATAVALDDRVDSSEVPGGAGTRVARRLRTPPPSVAAPRGFPRLPRAVVREWLLPPVYERLRAGRGEFLAELRPAVPMFVRFGGFDFDGDPAAPAKLDEFLRLVQRAVDSQGGNVLQLTVGDKGAYIYAVFGAPIAHEDDAARACAAALLIQALDAGTEVGGVQIGVASGRVRSGTYGTRHRRTFCCLGDPVNLAARLMSAAPHGATYTTQEVERAARSRFAFEGVGSLSLKGKALPVSAVRLSGPATETRPLRQYAGRALLGRQEELDLLVGLAERASTGSGQVAAVTAEPGTGKSHLTTTLSQLLESRDIPVLVGAATSIGGATSYLAWRPVIAQLLGFDEGRSSVDADGLADRLRHALGALDADLLPRLPLLGALFGVTLEDTELTATFDAQLRKTSLESLVVQMLSRRSRQSPVAIVLEDCHWLDPLSNDLLELVARSAGSLPLCLLLTYRPGPFAAPSLPHTTVLELQGLDDGNSRELVARSIEEVFGPGAVISERVASTLVARAEGNPFFLKELVRYLHDRGADPADPTSASVELPSGLSSLILSRIDTLAERPRRTLKVASVVGRDFSIGTLMGAYPELGRARTIEGHLRTLLHEGLVASDGATHDRFSFSHAVIQEVAYESLPYALRSTVHGQVASWLEAADPTALDLLAHHFWHSATQPKKRAYLLRAGEAAKAKFANAAAIDYFAKLVPLVEGGEREHALELLGAVHEVHGDQVAAERAYDEALALVEARGDAHAAAWTRVRRCTPIRRQGRFKDVAAELDQVEPLFESVGDMAGLAKALHLRGLIANQTGAPDEAWVHFQRSLEIRRSLGDKVEIATTLGNLGNAAIERGDYELGWQLTEESLALRREIEDRRNLSVSYNNLGMVAYLRKEYSRAMPLFQDAVQAGAEVGALFTEALARHSLANCERELGDDSGAQRNYRAALGACTTVGDQRWLCELLEDIALLVVRDRPERAFELLGAASSLRQEIGAQRVPYEEAIIDEHVVDARRALRARARAAETRGAHLGAQRAAQIASELVGGGT